MSLTRSKIGRFNVGADLCVCPGSGKAPTFLWLGQTHRSAPTLILDQLRLGVFINLLIWVVLSAYPYLWPGAAPVQATASERSTAQSAQESNSLEPGKPIQREISGGQTHSYKITMTSGQFLHIVVKQQGIDVAVALFAPYGKKISEADSDHLIEGLETVSAITEAPGAYLIEVHSTEKTAKAGRYEINVEELRAATGMCQ